jgi:type II secretory pathway pseudopilin PulG
MITNSKRGFLMLDALVTSLIIATTITMAVSVVFFGYKTQKENVAYFEALQVAQNHLEDLSGRSTWEDIDGTTREITDDVAATYELLRKGQRRVLTVRFEFYGRQQVTFALERKLRL